MFGQKRNPEVYTLPENETDTGLYLLDTSRQTPTSHQCVPDDVTDLLLDYVHSLRASTMYTITAACRLTYAQAVYWIDPPLTAIDQANNQLFMISKLE